ncbi:pyruvate kinase [Puniceicoccus vermicola]|nr:pyruvate kinase [Puniceicoccus vermicola]
MHHRNTKIIFTIGPATDTPEMLRALIREGVDICRINMAHAPREDLAGIVSRVREAGKDEGRDIAIMVDIKGPEIRTGEVSEPLQLKAGDLLDLACSEDADEQPDVPLVQVNYPGLINDLKEGSSILVDNGLLRFKVLKKTESRLQCEVEIGGKMGSRRHINLPGTHVSLPALTKKDYLDIEFSVAAGVDFFAQSFVREPEDVESFRRVLSEKGSSARIIAKIEDQQAISNLDDIIRASDGLMVARGDLGIECPYEDLPVIQKRAVTTCIRLRKPAIVATHMLESMIENPVPTRAEVSDITYAVAERTDAIMLSGETTVGKFPLDCVRVFKRIAETTEKLDNVATRVPLDLRNPKSKLVRSAARLAEDVDNASVIVFTRAGNLPQTVSSLRPVGTPIFAFTDQPHLVPQMRLIRGVHPFLIDFAEDGETTIQSAFRLLTEHGYVAVGSWAVLITTVLRRKRLVDGLQLRQVDPQE